MKKVFLFGNEDLKIDSLPLRILPDLQNRFPNIEFKSLDPNEEWEIPEEIIVIDTAVGIKEITVFDDLEKFSSPPRVGMHDFDALTNLRYLFKLGKIKKIKIIGVPVEIEEAQALQKISDILEKI